MEKFKENREKIGTILFFLGITIECFFMLYNLGSYTVPSWLNVGRCVQVAVGLFCVKIILTKYTPKEIGAMCLFFIFGVISYFATGRDEWVLRVFFLVVASKNIDATQVARYILKLAAVGGMIIFLLSLAGIGMPIINAMDYGRGVGVEQRWTFGMGHPNHFHGYICYMVTLLLYVYHEKCKLYHYVVLTVANIMLYYLTISRAGLLITQFVIVAVALVSLCKSFQKPKLWLIVGLMSVVGSVCFVMYAALKGVDGPVISKIDSMLTYRLTFIDWYGDPATWRWFSQSDDIGRAVIDVAYGAMINAYGYAVCIVYTLLNCLLVIHFYRKRNIYGIIVVISCAIYGLMENYINSYFLMYNLVLVMLFGNWNYLLQWREKKE